MFRGVAVLLCRRSRGEIDIVSPSRARIGPVTLCLRRREADSDEARGSPCRVVRLGAELDGRSRITAKRILLGVTVPLSGQASAFVSVGLGAKAYFHYVNTKGGVKCRKIEYRYYDDEYELAKIVQLTRKLV